VTGGGAYKYAELIEKKLGLKIAKEPIGHISGTIRISGDSFRKRDHRFVRIRAELIKKMKISYKKLKSKW
jgi:hypothetical protein